MRIDADFSERAVIHPENYNWVDSPMPGIDVMLLHQFETENVMLIRWAPNTPFREHMHHGGEEVFVIGGSYSDEDGEYRTGSWVRLPDQSSHSAISSSEGALLFLKAGHLPAVRSS